MTTTKLITAVLLVVPPLIAITDGLIRKPVQKNSPERSSSFNSFANQCGTDPSQQILQIAHKFRKVDEPLDLMPIVKEWDKKVPGFARTFLARYQAYTECVKHLQAQEHRYADLWRLLTTKRKRRASINADDRYMELISLSNEHASEDEESDGGGKVAEKRRKSYTSDYDWEQIFKRYDDLDEVVWDMMKDDDLDLDDQHDKGTNKTLVM